MKGNYLFTLKDFTREEKLGFAVWLTLLSNDITDFSSNEEMQYLYFELVKELELEEHSRKVMKAVITKLKKDNRLTLREKIVPHRHTFDYNGPVEVQYREDDNLYDMSGNWHSRNLDEIESLRAVFGQKNQNFSNIIAWTFFYKEDKKRKTFTLPEDYVLEIPEEYKKYSRNSSCVNFMASAFNLSEDEALILTAAYYSHTVKELYPVFNNLVRNEDETRYNLYAKCIGMTVRDVKQNLRHDKKLISFGLMDTDGDIEQDTIDCIYGKDINSFFCDVLKEDNRKDSYPLDSFSVKSEETELAIRLLKNEGSSNILLYGAPGSGKTEYAKAISKALGYKTYIFKNELEVNGKENSENRALARLNCLLSLDKSDTVIIVDEAESILNTGSSGFFGMFFGEGKSSVKKGTVNMMLENSVNKVIWILNYTNPLDESTKRRFTYSICFHEMNSQMLKNIADTKLSKIEMTENLHTQLVDLMGKYHVTGASVDNMVKTIKGMQLQDIEEEAVVRDVKKVLEANSTLLFGKKKMREKVRDNYDVTVLNSTIPAEKIVEMVINARDFAEKNEIEGGDAGIRMLFYGMSGTGKTELARFIAEKLNKKIILKRASDILGMYVGENEANIRAAFAEAESTGGVLLFDEADSFFADREGASRSWERTMVNEFLTQMEEFSGILICTTNLRKIMDPAMQRRFHILSEFKSMDENGIKKLLGKFFGAYEFDDKQIQSLIKKDSVTPGDFGQLAGKIRFMPQSEISSELIIDELIQIQNEKESSSRKIGFGE